MDTSAAITRRERRALLPLFHFVVGDLSGNSIASELDDADAVVALKLYEKEPGMRGGGRVLLKPPTLLMYML